ncbi:MAG: glycosyltransferase family 2 protein [Alistipes sp.]
MIPEISIITVNYNGLELTCRLVDSLLGHNTVPAEIIVVDNGSAVNEAEILHQRYPALITLRSDQNLGFAGGNNLGIKVSQGKYILLLNNDTEIKEDGFRALCDTLDTHSEAGVVCPKIRFFQPPCNIQFAGYTPLTAITLRNELIGFGASDQGQYDTPHESPYAHGAAMMVRRAVITDVGLLPELFFLYYEELDWSAHITAHGWTIRYDPRCTVFHKESATTGGTSPLRTFYLSRNRLLFGWRNRKGITRYLTILYQLCIALPKNTLVALCHHRSDLASAGWRGAWSFIRMIHHSSKMT